MTDERPRVGFLGVGWIGLHRLRSLVDSDRVRVAGFCDPSREARLQACALVPQARACASYDDLLELQPDGVVIATPSGLHAAQCVRALHRGIAVFCQKPLACSYAETRVVLQAARRADRLLRVDLSYRHVQALQALRAAVQAGDIGRVYAADLTFHNAYGPNQAWAQQQELAGGGCLIDLGVHLLDAAFWIFGAQPVVSATSRLYSQGQLLPIPTGEVEDYAACELHLADGLGLSLRCSWRSSFGTHARIGVHLFGERGGLAFENLDGSFFDFTTHRFRGSGSEFLAGPPDDWGGRAICAWAKELAESPRFRPADDLLPVAWALDALYGRAQPTPEPSTKVGVA
jgi:predicted dehydrogenase